MKNQIINGYICEKNDDIIRIKVITNITCKLVKSCFILHVGAYKDRPEIWVARPLFLFCRPSYFPPKICRPSSFAQIIFSLYID